MKFMIGIAAVAVGIGMCGAVAPPPAASAIVSEFPESKPTPKKPTPKLGRMKSSPRGGWGGGGSW